MKKREEEKKRTFTKKTPKTTQNGTNAMLYIFYYKTNSKIRNSFSFTNFLLLATSFCSEIKYGGCSCKVSEFPPALKQAPISTYRISLDCLRGFVNKNIIVADDDNMSWKIKI